MNNDLIEVTFGPVYYMWTKNVIAIGHLQTGLVFDPLPHQVQSLKIETWSTWN